MHIYTYAHTHRKDDSRKKNNEVMTMITCCEDP